MAIDEGKLHEFLGRFVTDLGAVVAVGNVVIGHRLGLYRALASGPATPQELAQRTHTNPRYVAEWLRGQAAGGYVAYDAAADSYSMTEEQAFALASPTAPSTPPVRSCWPSALCGQSRGSPRPSAPVPAWAGTNRTRGRLHRLRAFLPPRLHRQPDPVLDSRAGRRRGQAAGRRHGRGHRLRARGVDNPARRNTRTRSSSARTITATRSNWRASGPPMLASPTGRSSRSPRHRRSPDPATTSPPPSTACMTWAIRSQPPGMSASPSSRTAPDRWSSPSRPTTKQAT